MFNRDTLFSSYIDNLSNWNFNEQVARVFLNMAQRSIPGYSDIIFMIGVLAKHFVQPGTRIYDLGCSLGTVTRSICRNIRQKNCKVIAVDNSSAMIKYCQDHIHSCKTSTPIDIIQGDIRNIDIINASMVILNFTLQFLNSNDKQPLLNKIYQGLTPKGVLILSEKLRFKNKKINTLLFKMHHDFKYINGYSELEINQKSIMLENTMFIDSFKDHKIRLKRAGFSHIELWFQYLNFGSFIGIK